MYDRLRTARNRLRNTLFFSNLKLIKEDSSKDDSGEVSILARDVEETFSSPILFTISNIRLDI